MLMLTIETFLLLLLAGLLGLAVGHLLACGRSGGGVDWSDDKPWLRDGRAVPAAPVLPAAPTLLEAGERARLATSLADAKGGGEATTAPAAAGSKAASDDVAAKAGADEAAAASSAATSSSAASAAFELPAEVAAAAVTPTVAPEDAERAAAADAVGTRPMAIAAPLAGKADKLTLIKGVGPQNEKKLHGLGVYHFAQIAAWTPENATWAGSFMAFPGRIEREDWIGQAKLLATGAAATGTSATGSAADDVAEKAAAEAAAKAEAEKAAAEQAAAEAAAKAEAEKAAAEQAAAEAAAKAEAEKAAAEKAAAEAASAQGTTSDYALPTEMAAAAITPTVAPEDAERAAAADAVGTRPLALAAPVGGTADDLKRIRGIGPANEKKLHGLGVYHFSQIAAWTEENAKWAGSFMAFPGRIEREEWIDQAKILATGAETAFSKRVDAGEVPSSQ